MNWGLSFHDGDFRCFTESQALCSECSRGEGHGMCMALCDGTWAASQVCSLFLSHTLTVAEESFLNEEKCVGWSGWFWNTLSVIFEEVNGPWN